MEVIVVIKFEEVYKSFLVESYNKDFLIETRPFTRKSMLGKKVIRKQRVLKYLPVKLV